MTFQFAEKRHIYCFYLETDALNIVEINRWLAENIDSRHYRSRVNWINLNGKRTMNLYFDQHADAVQFRLRFEPGWV